MRTRQVVAVILISAATSVSSMWAYNKFQKKEVYNYQTEAGKVPSNYAGYFDSSNGGANAPADFTQAAAAAIRGARRSARAAGAGAGSATPGRQRRGSRRRPLRHSR